ncbi:MAG: hypothetical protein Q4B26_19800 [Eubacteriales bacterium]|nr:hypothetical protein [Eubacteriales bacterium]
MVKRTVDWYIHLLMNGAPCAKCGKAEDDFLPYTCNAHTHGMENYHHLNFQMVIAYPQKEIMRILNTLSCMVRDGRKFQDGELVEKIYEDCKIRLDKRIEEGEEIFRVVVPDKNNLLPEDENCGYPYSMQTSDVEDLYKKDGVVS